MKINEMKMSPTFVNQVKEVVREFGNGRKRPQDFYIMWSKLHDLGIAGIVPNVTEVQLPDGSIKRKANFHKDNGEVIPLILVQIVNEGEYTTEMIAYVVEE